MYQSHNKYEAYKINNKKFKYDVKDLTFVAISHLSRQIYFKSSYIKEDLLIAVIITIKNLGC